MILLYTKPMALNILLDGSQSRLFRRHRSALKTWENVGLAPCLFLGYVRTSFMATYFYLLVSTPSQRIREITDPDVSSGVQHCRRSDFSGLGMQFTVGTWPTFSYDVESLRSLEDYAIQSPSSPLHDFLKLFLLA